MIAARPERPVQVSACWLINDACKIRVQDRTAGMSCLKAENVSLVGEQFLEEILLAILPR